METGFRIGHIVSSLQRFSRESSKDPFESISMDQLVQDSIGLCQAKFSENGVLIRYHLQQDGPVNCQSGQISQVIVNLLNNSFDAVSNLPSERRWIEVKVNFSATLGHTQIVIQDGGHGIAVEHREKIMNPFFTTKEIGKGTGLGLSVPKGIVEAHHGKIYFNYDSKVTEVVVEIPNSQQGKLAA